MQSQTEEKNPTDARLRKNEGDVNDLRSREKGGNSELRINKFARLNDELPPRQFRSIFIRRRNNELYLLYNSSETFFVLNDTSVLNIHCRYRCIKIS